MSDEMDKDEILLAEWKEIRESLRYFGNKRFTQLTVFIAATGFMVKGFFDQNNRRSLLVIGIMGIILSILFLLMEKRTAEYIDAFIARGKKVEEDLGHLQLIHKRPEKPKLKISGTVATYMLYGLVFFFWVVSLYLK